ncbi:MAG TPA: secondary thiamine-phosphate synthase enzyme YjbQ [Phycisphaerae bacterium]|nr:YjbQ family protein [Phycisphaerae bacterium]HOI54150.1 secondary thiamine-phosphate synthase enzyme YjbQ [Phycisphaerae bacterium]
MQTFPVRTARREQLLDITGQVAAALRDGPDEGVCIVFVPHTTAAVTINENADPSVVADMLAKTSRMVPRDEGYAHAEGNSDAHIKASLVGSSVTIPIAGGRLALGTWQGIYFCEFDGPRSRTVHVQVLGR